MSYQVLARTWRPRNFEQMVGQTHVLQALINALKQKRLHHAYLFSGTRGVGKTTLARILAKCFNCETGITATPCDQCDTCNEINQGCFVDLIEVDAASRTKVEDMRELLDNVPYTPSKGRFKVYLIDEVHMLSGHSFNALLKTLEEPPPHIKFLLATTDPQRLPITVLSRCLQFHLKNLPPTQIQSHLESILKQENIPYEPHALAPIAHAAKGSVRDALSLLDQAIAYSDNHLQTHAIKAMLGSIENQPLIDLLTALHARDTAQLLSVIRQLAEHTTDFAQALEALLMLLHRVALTQTLPEAYSSEWENAEDIQTLAQTLTPEDVQLYYQIALIGQRDLPLAPTSLSGFEMILMRMMAFVPHSLVKTQMPSPAPHSERSEESPYGGTLQGDPSAPRKNLRVDRDDVPVNRHSERSEGSPDSGTLQGDPSTPRQLRCRVGRDDAPVSGASHGDPSAPRKNLRVDRDDRSIPDWTALIQALKLTGPTKALAQHCTLTQLTDQDAHLLLDPAQAPLLNPRQKERLTQAFSTHYQRPMRVTVSSTPNTAPPTSTPARIARTKEEQALATAKQHLDNDQHVQTLISSFSAEIIPDTIKLEIPGGN